VYNNRILDERTAMPEDNTHFGFQQVPISEKAERVAEVFRKVARQYDAMNDLMSLGSHRLMKRIAVETTRAKPGHRILDLAGGTGDLSKLLAQRVGSEGQVVLCDINADMVQVGRDRLIDQGFSDVTYALGDAEQLPFADQSFDAIMIGFGLRNVTRKEVALKAMCQALKPGCRVVILEFSTLQHPSLAPAYKAFSALWPKVGRWVTGDGAPYEYLVESIAMHPDQETLADMMRAAGFVGVGYDNLLGGVAALHYGEAPLTASEAVAPQQSE
jgi:demethylmenaquinone methyltransferase/2-methoxy-6-polyprenyl-1,4-benzoquinol methylase